MTNFDKMFQQFVPLSDEWEYEQGIPTAEQAAFMIWVASRMVKHEDWAVTIEAGLNLECGPEIRSWARH